MANMFSFGQRSLQPPVLDTPVSGKQEKRFRVRSPQATRTGMLMGCPKALVTGGQSGIPFVLVVLRVKDATFFRKEFLIGQL